MREASDAFVLPFPRPVAGVVAAGVPSSPRSLTPVDLKLDGNEGAAPAEGLLRELAALPAELLRRYPDARPLEAALARRLNLAPDQVVVTAGGDEALDRIVRTFVARGAHVLLPVPTFEMVERYLKLAEADVEQVAWPDGAFPRESLLARVRADTVAIVVVSPNNPTGATARAADLAALARAAPQALLLIDLAYVEFADEDLTRAALALGNALVVRTFSKAFGLAGLRVGYVAGPARLVRWLRAGSPYPVSAPSLALALRRLESPTAEVAHHVACVRVEREQLARRLDELGARVSPSQGNFVLARFRDAAFVRDALAGLGIAVRSWPQRRGLEDALRITCPIDEAACARLLRALAAALAPQALLLDLDGVVADVSRSYRAAIAATTRSFGVELETGAIAGAKAAGDANDDWELTRRLLAQRGVVVPLAEVTARFEALYQGSVASPGLRTRERLLVSRDLLEQLARRIPLAIVTGRPRRDAERFLEEQAIAPLFRTLVAREDAPLKPDPAPVALALERLGVARAWMAGDTPDDVRAARAAGVVPLGVVAPGDDAAATGDALLAAGAGRVLADLGELLEQLP
jgi:histidinol-phosphate aminotransferase